MSGSAGGFADEIAIGRYGTRDRPPPRCRAARDAARSARSPTRQDRHGRRSVLSRRRVRRLRKRALGPQPQAGAAHHRRARRRAVRDRRGCDEAMAAALADGEPDPPGDRGDRHSGVGAGGDRPPARASSCPRPSSAPPARCACFRAGRARRRCAWAPARATRSSRCRTRTTSRTRTGDSRAGGEARLRRRGARRVPGGSGRPPAAAAESGRHARPAGRQRRRETVAAVTRALARETRIHARAEPAARGRRSRRELPARRARRPLRAVRIRGGAADARARRSRALRDRVPWRRMERRRRLRRRPRRPRPCLGGSVRLRQVGWMRVDATPPGPPPPRAGRLSRGHGCARLLLEPLGRRLRSGPAAGARAPRGSPPGGAAPRRRRARASFRSSSPPACCPLLVLVARRLAAAARAGRTRRARRGPRPRSGRRRAWARSIVCIAGRWGGWHAPAGRAAETKRRTNTRCAWARSGLIAADGFSQLTERYTAARFGGHDADDKLVAELAAKLAIRTGGPGHPGSGPGLGP